MNLTTFLRLEAKNLASGKAVIAVVVCLLAAGVYGIFYGKNTIEKQKAIIAQIPQFQAEHTQKQLALNAADLGNLLYYHQFSTVHQPSAWAAFSIGQRDTNPFNVKVRMLALENQLYDSEFSNPQNLLYGNFDAAFVIVFLFPLAIIALCHNLISAEQENGIWNLLRSQPVAIGKIVAWRLLLRFAAVSLLAFALIAASCVFLDSAFDVRFVYALLIAFVYLAFWFALAAFVISLQKTSTFNALALLGTWIFLTILAPALLNLVVSTVLPVSESFDLTVAQREGYHRKWDAAKAETMQKFYRVYPQYREIPIPEDKFSWGWYYAAQLMGDLEASADSANYTKKLAARDALTNRAALLLPPVNAQNAFNRLSRTDLQSHLDYLESIRRFHTELRERFYPLLFRNAASKEVDWENLPRHRFSDEAQTVAFPAPVWSIAVAAALFAIAARRKFGEFLN